MRRLRRTVIALMAVAALGAFAALAVLGGSASDARADGTSVVAKLAGAADLVGKLTGTVGADGDYGKLVTNASQVPFLGANPTAGVDGLFSLEGLTGLTALTALSQDAPVSDVTAMVQKVGPTVTAPARACRRTTRSKASRRCACT